MASAGDSGAWIRRVSPTEEAERQASRVSLKVALADFALATGIALTTGFFSSGFDQVVGGQANVRIYCIAVAGGIVWMLLAALWRERLWTRRRTLGTLYYLRLLSSGMRSTHVEHLATARPGHMDVRAVTRWFTSSAHQPIDISSTVLEMAETFQLTMNDDSIDTEFTIAPDMVWPGAMGVGFHSYLFDRTRIQEVDDKRSAWKLDTRPLVGKGLGCLEGAHPESARRLPRADELPANEARPILLQFNLTGQTAPLPAGWAPKKTVRLDLSSEPNDSETLRMSVNPGVAHMVFVEPNVAAARCAQHIFDVQRSNPEAKVVLVARLPKSVAFALGWRLAEKQEVGPEPPWDPWERLITVQLIPAFRLDGDGKRVKTRSGDWEVERNDPVVTRVCESQPSLAEMVEVVGCLSN